MSAGATRDFPGAQGLPAARRTLAVLTIPGWRELPWLVHGFSTRTGGVSTAYRAGDLNLGFTVEDSRESVERNRELLVGQLLGLTMGAAAGDNGGARMSGAGGRLARLKQVHSNVTYRVSSPTSGTLMEGDGLITDTPGVLLSILTADCVPVLVVDPKRRVVGAFHAGWRGTVSRIVELGVQKMREEFGSEPRAMLAAVGPAIGACCYGVGEEVRQQFGDRFSYAGELFSGVGAEAPGLHLNLAEANRRQLVAAGLPEEGVTLTGACTSCETDRFFSHRAEHGVTGRMMAVVGVQTQIG